LVVAIEQRLHRGDLQCGDQRGLGCEVRVDGADGAVDSIGDCLHGQAFETELLDDVVRSDQQ
jgi:hypothetical protein